jgi:GT2 family glycosyltransferase
MSAAATIVICTHNRADLSREAVERPRGEARPPAARSIVVDNASTDATPAVLREPRRRGSGRRAVVHEPRLGLSVARNRGLAEARGDVVAYLDDDAVPRRLARGADSRRTHDPHVVAVGGRIVLALRASPRAGFRRAPRRALGVRPRPGRAPRPLRRGHVSFGANISFRTDARDGRRLLATVGPLGRHQLVHDETDLCYRLEHAGGVVWYAPGAVVDHHVVPERLTPHWMLRRHWTGGQSAAVFILRNRGVLRACGASGGSIAARSRAAVRHARADRPVALRARVPPA